MAARENLKDIKMGFGTLFFGYFLLLNIIYFRFTDIICALIMLLGLYKLSSVSRHFKMPLYFALPFAAFSLVELLLGAFSLFGGGENELTVSILGILRSLLLAAFTVILLRAMHDIAKELEVDKVPLKARTMIVWTLLVYGMNILFQTTSLSALLPTEINAFLYLFVVVGTIVVVIANLSIIHSCYVYICMPEDLEPKPKEKKPSRFAFINEFRRRREEHQAELARAEEERRRRRAEKRKGRKGK